jgi:hypothetical protein
MKRAKKFYKTDLQRSLSKVLLQSAMGQIFKSKSALAPMTLPPSLVTA